jgi:DNA-binding CsgD family transcriptional regulator
VELLERDAELEALSVALTGVAAGEQRTIGVLGEAGIGKSALLGEAGGLAAESGLLVLAGSAAEHERDVPFSLVVDALDDHVASLHPERVRSAGVELGAVLPSASDDAEAAELAVGGPAERYRYHRALRALLELLGRERPFALVLDDLHWADDASVEFVLHLLRRTPRVPHLLLFALRWVDPAPRLLDAARAAAGWQELPLTPLTDDAARALLPEDLDASLRDRMASEAGGNPLFLNELARLGPGADAALPSTVFATVQQEISGLAPEARALIDGAAVAGDPFDPDVAAGAARLGRDDAIAALDVLVAADLVHAAGTGRSFRFRHPLVRRAVYDATPPGWRLGAHERAAWELAERGAAPGQYAYHVEQFARPGDEEAIAVLQEAALSATDTAPAAAARWYGAALRLLPHDDSRGAVLLAPMALALASAGRLGESGAALQEAIARLPADAEERMALVGASVTVSGMLGEYEDAKRQLLAALPDAPPEARPKLMAFMSSIAFYQGDVAGVSEWAARAAAELHEGSPPELAAHVDAVAAMGRLWSGEAAPELAERAERRLREVNDVVLGRNLDVAWAVAGNLGQAELFAQSLAVVGRGLRLARATRQGHLVIHFHILMSLAELPLLELGDALEHAEAAEETARLEGLGGQLGFALFQRARVLAVRGEAAEAARAATECDELYRGFEDSMPTRLARAFNAVVRYREDHERVLREIESASGPDLERVNPSSHASLRLALVRAALATGRLDDAEAWAEAAMAHATRMRLPASTLRATRARAEVLIARSEPAAGADLALGAAADAETAGLRLEELEARLLAGRALLATGDREPALEELQRVAAAAAAAGAGALQGAATRELRRAGSKVSAGARRAAGGGPDSLTTREREVAELVAQGRSNKEVAGALYLSEKTVEHHLSRIYAKLEVRTRAELAAQLR